MRPQGRIGVDELGENEGFDSGYREAFHDFDTARSRFLELLSQADAAASHSVLT